MNWLQRSLHKSAGWAGKGLGQLVVAALLLALAPLAPAAAKDDSPRVHPALLQLAAEHPDDVFQVIVQREVKNKNLPDDDPEAAVEQAGLALTVFASGDAAPAGPKGWVASAVQGWVPGQRGGGEQGDAVK